MYSTTSFFQILIQRLITNYNSYEKYDTGGGHWSSYYQLIK